MFDDLSNVIATAAAAASWQADLQRGDIVCARFPVSEGDGGPCKLRPCVVMETGEIDGGKTAVIAYGTTSKGKANAGYELRLRRPEVLEALGLHAPTRFVCSRRLVASLDNAMFEAPKGRATPVLGRLASEELERLNALRARIQAEADIAAERRAERRKRRRTISVRGREVIVETRRGKRLAGEVR